MTSSHVKRSPLLWFDPHGSILNRVFDRVVSKKSRKNYEREILWYFFGIRCAYSGTREIFFNIRKEMSYLRAAVEYPPFISSLKMPLSHVGANIVKTITSYKYSETCNLSLDNFKHGKSF